MSLIEQLDRKTWVASVTRDAAQAIAEEDHILWVNLIAPGSKIAPVLEDADIPLWRRRANGNLVFSVLFHRGVTSDEVVALAGAIRADLEDFEAANFDTLRTAHFLMDPARLGALSEAEVVARIGPSSPPPGPDNETGVQPLSRVDVVQGPPYNLSGDDVSVGVWEANEGTAANPETAIRDTHQNLTPRVVLEADQAGPPPSGFSNHGTHPTMAHMLPARTIPY